MMNAFEMLMNARNKVIGTNSPAKEGNTPSASGVDAAAEPAGSDTKTKRKLQLEEWADRKGAAKRRIHDDEAEEYVHKQMDKRAKRLKRLLANGQRSVEVDEADASEVDADVEAVAMTADENDALVEVDQSNDLSGSYVKFNFKKFGKGKVTKKSRISKLKVFDSDEENTSDTKPVEVVPIDVMETVDLDTSTPAPTILTALRSPPPTKSPHKRARQKSIYLPKTPTKSPRKSISKVVPMDAIDMVLASPIKKRDSLLGYFNKVDKSPTEADVVGAVKTAVTEIAETTSEPRKRGRQPKNTVAAAIARTQRISVERHKTPSPTVRLPDDAATGETPSTSDGSALRPKRGCRNKIVSYTAAAEPIERSPATISAQKSVKRARRLLSSCSPQKGVSPGRTPRSATGTPKTKLASIFCKAPARAAIDPETARARQEFLRSGIPEKMRQDIERQKTMAEAYACELDVFPLVSHVTQLRPQTTDNDVIPEVLPPIRYRPEETVDTSTTQYKRFQLGKATGRLQPEVALVSPTLASMDALKLTKPKDLVKQLKEIDSSKFLYFRGYKQVRRMFEEHQAAAPDRSASGSTVTKSDARSDDASNDSVIEIIEPSSSTSDDPVTTGSNGNAMFTEKYKPIICDEIVVNSAPAFQLKKFLDTWQENYTLRNSRHKRTTSSNTDTDDDFEGGSNSASTTLSKAICLVGPTGVGKTNAVYAVANEMNFKVLEINAGCKRTGRKMLQELQEATQSHQVKSGTGGNNTGERLFRSASSEESSSASAAPTAGPTKLSLILIEDADIVFEQDNGFVDAIFQLVATSKRPVILVANRRACPHLARLIGANSIHFEPANVAHAGKWLSLMSIAEHRYVGHVDCAQLYVHNGHNMRRTVLDMQFFLQSGGDRHRHPDGQCGQHYAHQRLYETFARPANGCVLTLPVDFNGIHDKTEEILRVDGVAGSAATGGSLADTLTFLETMSAAQRLQACGRQRRLRCGGDGDDDGLTWNMVEEVAFDMAEGTLVQRRRRGASKFSIDPPPVGRNKSAGQSA